MAAGEPMQSERHVPICGTVYIDLHLLLTSTGVALSTRDPWFRRRSSQRVTLLHLYSMLRERRRRKVKEREFVGWLLNVPATG